MIFQIFAGAARAHLRSGARPAVAAALLLGLLATACGGGQDVATTPAGTSSAGSRGTPTARLQLTGESDTTFGQDGLVTTNMGANEQIGGMVIQPDGKIVVAGEARPGPNTRPKFAAARYNPDGSLDESFGDGGKVYVGLVEEDYDYAQGRRVALQEDGKILLVGEAQNPKMYHHTFAVVRLNPDGTLDASFGADGRVLTPIGTETGFGADEGATAVAVAPDGKIVVAGYIGGYFPDFVVVRYNPDGSLDEEFGDAGKVVAELGYEDVPQDVKIQPDGKIVVAGYGDTNPNFAMLRYNPDGSLDEEFGNGGKVISDFRGGQDWAQGIVLLPDGKIVLGGLAQRGSPICGDYRCELYGFALAQYNPDGSLDTSFGDEGWSVYEFNASVSAYAIARLTDGRLALAGHAGNDDFAVGLYNPDGTLDESFGGGAIQTDFAEKQDRAYAIAVQADGKIVVAGTAVVDPESYIEYDFALARYR